MGQILGFSVKKGSGKNTAANFVLGYYMKMLGIIQHFYLTDQGQLHITDIYGNTDYDGIFDCMRNNEIMRVFLYEHIHPYIKIYSLADLLKQEVCMKILGLTHEQCYGTDEQKNQLTHLMWENTPDIIIDGKAHHEDGPMTAREVMQYVGSNLFRKIYNDVWINATIRLIQQENPDLAIVCDVRFPNEVEGINTAGGQVIRFTRSSYEDTHISETALDANVFDWNKFSAVIDNAKMSIDEQSKNLYDILLYWNIIDKMDINKKDN